MRLKVKANEQKTHYQTQSETITYLLDKARSFRERKYIQQWVYWYYRHQGSQTTVFNTSWKLVTYSQDAVMSLKSMPQVLRKQLLGSYCAYLPPSHTQSLVPAAELLAHRI